MDGWQRAFALRSRPRSETNLMLDVFTEESGRVHLVVKGAHSKRLNLKGALQPFTPLLVRFGSRGEVRTLRNAEAASLALPFSDITLYSGLYVNELISRILEHETCFSKLFFDYLHCIQVLTGTSGPPGPVLRRFELVLLGYLGYGVDFLHRAGNDEPVDDTMTYRYREEKDFIVSLVINNNTFIGHHLKVLANRRSPDVDTLRVAERFTRIVLKPYLGGKPLKSRELFRQFMPA